MALVIPLLFLPYQAMSQTEVAPVWASLAPGLSLQFVPIPTAPQPPDYETIKHTNDARVAKETADALEAAKQAQIVSQAAKIEVPTTHPTPTPPVGVLGLTGSLGYSLPYGNCVDEPGVNNPGWGNPIDWAVTTATPEIGLSILFYFNHVAVVSGLWANGDIEVRQQNSPGMPHRIPASEARGYR